MKTYTFHQDPGHGWLAVKRQELVDLGIHEQISHYSYQRGKTVYLEEDCDLQIFLAAKKLIKEAVSIRDSNTNKRSPIRSYESYTPFPSVGEMTYYETYKSYPIIIQVRPSPTQTSPNRKQLSCEIQGLIEDTAYRSESLEDCRSYAMNVARKYIDERA